jgi:hypothetical protein
MQAFKATYQDGHVTLNEKINLKGRFDAVLVLLDPDPWETLLNDPRPRTELTKDGQEAIQEYERGNTTPVDPDRMP